MVTNTQEAFRTIVRWKSRFNDGSGELKRYVGLFRAKGAAAFYQSKVRQRSETKLTAEVKEKAQQLWSAGRHVAQVARETGVLATTLHKAVRAKRLDFKKKRRQ